MQYKAGAGSVVGSRSTATPKLLTIGCPDCGPNKPKSKILKMPIISRKGYIVTKNFDDILAVKRMWSLNIKSL
jgi:hypothetical protein